MVCQSRSITLSNCVFEFVCVIHIAFSASSPYQTLCTYLFQSLSALDPMGTWVQYLSVLFDLGLRQWKTENASCPSARSRYMTKDVMG